MPGSCFPPTNFYPPLKYVSTAKTGLEEAKYRALYGLYSSGTFFVKIQSTAV